MRLFSNAESVDRGEISVLAILETILAMSITVWIIVYFDTMVYFAISVSLAPFLLLRTRRSMILGVRVLDYLMDSDPVYRFTHKTRWLGAITTLLISLASPLLPIVARVISAITTAFRHPIRSVIAIPKNWYRTTVCLDVFRPPEVVPGYDQMSSECRDMSFNDGIQAVLEHLRDLKGFLNDRRVLKRKFAFGRWMLTAFASFIVLTFFTPSLIYRWSLKSTSIIYMPLLWISWTATRRYPVFRNKLRSITESDIAKAITWYSIVVVFAFLAKFAFLAIVAGFAEWWNTTPLLRFFSVYVVPDEIPLWQVAGALNATLALGLFLYAKGMLRCEEINEKINVRVVRTFETIRVVLTLYTTACLLYLTIDAVDGLTLPKFGGQVVSLVIVTFSTTKKLTKPSNSKLLGFVSFLMVCKQLRRVIVREAVFIYYRQRPFDRFDK